MAGSLAGSKLNFRSCRRSSWARTWPRQTSHGGPAARRRSVVKRAGLYLPSVYLDASGPAPARDRRYPLEGRRPHVKLYLFAHPKSVVKQIRESVLAACPALDLEDDNPVFLVCPELDLPGLQMGLKRRQPEHRSLALHYANWAVPGTGHSNYVLIVHPHCASSSAELAERRELRGGDRIRFTGYSLDELVRREVALADSDAVTAME